MQLATVKTEEAHPCLKIEGRFDAFETDAFKKRLEELLGEASSVTLDMADVVFVDSSALAELVRAMKHCRERGGDLHIVNPSDPVRVIFELTRLDTAFSISSSS